MAPPPAARRVRLVPTLLAVVFAGSTVLFTILWSISVRPTAPDVEIGFQNRYLGPEREEAVESVYRGSPAEKAGLLAGDRIVAFDGVRIADSSSMYSHWRDHKAGQTVRLTVERPGLSSPIFLTAEFRKRRNGLGPVGWVRNFFPVPFVVVGLTVLFLRLEDRNVWILALLFGAFAATPGFPTGTTAIPASLRLFATGYQTLFLSLLGPLFYFFFAVFPSRSPLDRRWPWLKWAAIGGGLSLALPGLQSGTLGVPPPLLGWVGEAFSEALGRWFIFGFLGLGLVSLAANFTGARDPELRRKLRVIVWGAAVGVCPALIDAALQVLLGYKSSPWVEAATKALLFLFPLAFAYAVVIHRVLEIPVLLKRSARYVLVQRGFTFVLSLVSIGLMLLFAFSFSGRLRAAGEAAEPAGLGAVIGTALLWGGLQVHRRVSRRIDRAFFRSAYDAQMILEDLAEQTRAATDRSALMSLLERHIGKALQPRLLAIRLEPENGAPPGFEPEYVVPIVGRNGRALGSIVLGPRLSEEPYSGEDKRLLASVAGQAGTALENIQLAEEIAARIENERRTAREMEIARDVQARLLPQASPALPTLECAARCIQARSVGGDYYDFIDLGGGKTGFVLADVAGKGVHAALLMAHVQAQLRSHCAAAPLEPLMLLKAVNGGLWQSTAAQHYATLFFGIYDEGSQRLSYINCGHNPPLWLRPGDAIERLEATATVIGAFERWTGSVREIQLAPGDLLVIFSDGVTEAARGEEEFGEARLLEVLRANRDRAAGEVLEAVLAAVQQFSAGAQSDDITLLIARAK